MLRAFLPAFVALGFLASGPALAADETYTLKLYQSKKGDKIDHEKSETSKGTVLITAGGNEMKEDISGSEKEVFTEEILELKPGAKLATKLTRSYSVAEKTTKDNTTTFAYDGKTVLIEKKGDKYEFSIKGKVLDESDTVELAKKFNAEKENEPRDQDLLPTTPVKVGEGWKIPAATSAKLFESLDSDKMKVDAKKSTIEGKLLKVYKQDERSFATFELNVTVILTEIDLGGQLVKTSAGSKFVLKATIDTCIDGTVVFSDSKSVMTADLTAEIPNVGSVTLKTTATGTEKIRRAKQ